MASRRFAGVSRPSTRLCAGNGDLYGEQWYTPEDQYLSVGLAHCFEKNDEGKLVDRLVIEPISANSLEAMSHGAKTSYIHVFGILLEDALKRGEKLPSEFDSGTFCENYDARCDAAARTWMRPHAVDNLMDIVPLGMVHIDDVLSRLHALIISLMLRAGFLLRQVKSSFNYDTTDMRVLNMENVVSDSDNIKQDMSIDAYGRKEEKEEREDSGDIDSLLMN